MVERDTHAALLTETATGPVMPMRARVVLRQFGGDPEHAVVERIRIKTVLRLKPRHSMSDFVNLLSFLYCNRRREQMLPCSLFLGWIRYANVST
ncbi:hypothetical protein M8494_20280 [Serratia ureilytica]